MNKQRIFIEQYDIRPLTPEQALDKIMAASEEDCEGGHVDADDALCGLLLHLGFSDIVEQYLRIPKWYA